MEFPESYPIIRMDTPITGDGVHPSLMIRHEINPATMQIVMTVYRYGDVPGQLRPIAERIIIDSRPEPDSDPIDPDEPIPYVPYNPTLSGTCPDTPWCVNADPKHRLYDGVYMTCTTRIENQLDGTGVSVNDYLRQNNLPTGR